MLNEVYPDPGSGKSEFFELYNRSTSSLPLLLENYTLVSFFESPTEKGFCVMDLPNLSVSPKGFFVGASALPFSYQGINNSTAADFSWNSAAFTSNNGYIKRWVLQSNNLTDGNPNYDEVPLAAGFNDFFQRRTGTGASFTIFLYKDGVLINAVNLGTGGNNGVIASIISMPPLYVDMSGSSTDFSIDFSGYGIIPVESVSQDAGSDNGFIREADGACASWTKSSSQVQHTPQQSNGYVDALMGTISVTALIQPGNAQTGSNFIYDVVSAPTTSFPIELQAYKDNGSTNLYLDAGDEYVESNIENVVTDGPFTTNYFPYSMNMLLVVISNAGCIDKVRYAISNGILPIKLLYLKGEPGESGITIKWKVTGNELIQTFEMEQSFDGVAFTKTGSVTGNNIQGEQSYSYSEKVSWADKIFYRLKIVSKDQKVDYSTIISFSERNYNKNFLRILGNPVKDKLTLGIISAAKQTGDINIYDISGHLKGSEKVNLQPGDNFIGFPLTKIFVTGIYFAELNTGKEKFTVRFIKQ